MRGYQQRAFWSLLCPASRLWAGPGEAAFVLASLTDQHPTQAEKVYISALMHSQGPRLEGREFPNVSLSPAQANEVAHECP